MTNAALEGVRLMGRCRRGRLAWSVAALGVVSSGVAMAQSSALEEIIVTAQFRAENIQDTPIAISAYDGNALQARSATNIADAANLAPNVSLSMGAGGFGQMASVFIRGVGQADPHFAVEPGVGMYVDDVYFGVLTGAIFELLDTDRVEVLRGPQGTLAGKNSIGGAIKLFSQRPGPETAGYADVALGSHGRIAGRAATNLTIADDRLYGRVSAMARHRDGYLRRLDYACVTGDTAQGTQRLRQSCRIGTEGGDSVWAARAALRWIAGDRVENTLSIDVTEDSSENPAAKAQFQSPLWAGNETYLTGRKSYTSYENYLSQPTGTPGAPPFVLPNVTPLDARGVSNNLDVRLGDSVSFQSITGYRESTVTFSNTVDASPASIIDQLWRLDHEQLTQEVRLSGETGGGIQWTVGAFYYSAEGVSEGRVNLPAGLEPGGGGLDLEILFRDPVETRSRSVFAHTVFHPTRNLSVTAAVRYTDDLKKFSFNRWDTNGDPHPLLGALVDFTSEYTGDRTDYRLALDYQWSERFMLYGQLATGYKGGGVNPRPFFVSQALPYEPEELEAFEIGFKSLLADGKVRLNAAAFFNEFKDLQLSLLSCDAFSPFPGAPCAMSANVGDADIKGFEVEAQFRPIDNFRVDVSLGVLDFEYQRVDPLTFVTTDMTTVYTPDRKVAAGLEYEFRLPNGGTLIPRLDYTYRSQLQTEAINSPATAVDALGLLNFRLTWRNPNDDWSAVLAVTNLTDEFYYESSFARPDAPYFAGTSRPGWPRELYVTLRRAF